MRRHEVNSSRPLRQRLSDTKPSRRAPALRTGAENEALTGAGRDVLERWVRELLADRRARTSLLLGQSRRVHYARRRLGQAARYLDGLMLKAEQEARAAWPQQAPCPKCGAPLSGVRAEERETSGHAVVHEHADGTRCESS
jgi:hypothetical protein